MGKLILFADPDVHIDEMGYAFQQIKNGPSRNITFQDLKRVSQAAGLNYSDEILMGMIEWGDLYEPDGEISEAELRELMFKIDRFINTG